jgi:transposase
MLSGGVQPVRTVLRALALQQLSLGKSASEVASLIPLTSKAVREIGRRYERLGREQALYEKQRPGAATPLEPKQRQRIIAMVCSDPPAGRSRWTVRLVAEEAVKRRLVPKVGRETIRAAAAPRRSQAVAGKNVERAGVDRSVRRTDEGRTGDLRTTA